MTTKRFTQTALILSGVAMISFSHPAKAGFEWKGPLEAPAPAAEAPAETGNMSDLAPVTSGQPPQAMPAAQQPMPMPAAQAMPAPAADALAGFATDVPLVMALQQIVPPGYQYSFASGVNPGTSVSWEGGKSWQDVLTDMLSRQGLGYAVQNNTVVVSVAQGGSVSAPAQTQSQPQMMSPAPDAAPAAAPAPVSGSSSTAPMNIISQPPARSGAAPGQPATASSGDAGGMSAMPSDNNAAAPANNASAQVPADKPKEVDIRRKRSPSLLERLGFTHSHDSADHDSASDTSGSAPAPQKMAAADTQPAVMTDMSQPQSAPPPPAQVAMAVPANQSAMVPANQSAMVPANQSAAVPANQSAAPVATNTSPAVAASAQGWQGAKGQTLRDVLKGWSDKAGVDLYWSIDYDYRLSDDMSFPGSYDEAVGHLLDKFSAVRPQPYGQLHQGGQGPRVLVIKSYDVAQ